MACKTLSSALSVRLEMPKKKTEAIYGLGSGLLLPQDARFRVQLTLARSQNMPNAFTRPVTSEDSVGACSSWAITGASCSTPRSA
jgi:hypothetical protein